jgi:replication-associated recombination protein RarA
MRLTEKFRPSTLAGVVGQPAAIRLREFALAPYASCWLLESGPGTGKTTAALALAHDLGCINEFAGLLVVPASELDIAKCHELFEVSLRLRPLEGKGWHVLVLEELDGIVSKQVERYLKVKLETGLPSRCIVVATSNGAGGINDALLERFTILQFSAGKSFATCAIGRLTEIWAECAPGVTPPPGYERWGWDSTGTRFSMRLALAAMQGYITRRAA